MNTASLRYKWLWICSMYGIGFLYWCYFLNWGDVRSFGDWPLLQPLVAVFQMALHRGQLPYHASFYCAEAMRDSYLFKSRLLAAPWVIVSPDVIMLMWTSLAHWFVLHIVLYYSIGFLGVVRWIRKLNLSASAATLLIVVYTFNGYYSAKVGVGHLPDIAGYFLIPWVFWMWVRFFESDGKSSLQKWIMTLEWSGLLLLIIMVGALHTIQAIALLTVCIFVFRFRQLPWLILGLGIACVGAAYQVAPVALFSGFAGGTRPMFSGFGSFTHPLSIGTALIKAFAVSIDKIPDAWWEQTAYLSWMGVGILACAIGSSIWRGTKESNTLRKKPFVWGVLIVFVCQLGSVLRVLWLASQHVVHVPVIDQLPVRMVIYVVLYLALVAAPDFDRMFGFVKVSGLRWIVKWGVLLGLAGLLVKNSWYWAVTSTSAYGVADPRASMCPQILTISGDESYKHVVNVSFGFSLLTVVALVILYLCLRGAQRKRAAV